MEKTIPAAEMRQKVMGSLACTEETKKFIQGIPEGLLCEWFYLCVLDGMPVGDLKRIYAVSTLQEEQKIHMLRQERQKFLRNRYTDTAKIGQELKELHQRVRDSYEESRHLRETLDSSIRQALKSQEESLKHQEHSLQLVVSGKDEIIRERDKKILELRAQLQEWQEKEDKRAASLNNGEENIPASGKPEKAKAAVKEDAPKKRKKPWPFWKDPSKEFIKKYLENEAFTQEQREYLICCLEEGDTAKEIEQYAVPSLSVDMMGRLRKLARKKP